MSTSPGEPEAPQRIGRFVVLSRIGIGAMGEVFSAYDAELDRKVAIKLLRRDARKNPRGTARLVREALALARLSHPNVVQIYDVGQVDGGVFIAMEFIQGRDLSRWLADEPRSWRQIVDVFVQAGQGLLAAHAAGLVHRDFKPENVMVGTDDRVRVLDFSVASAGEPMNSSIDLHASNSDLLASQPRTLTETEALIGTPAYMAPEQLRRLGADAASDQFSFCVSLHEALYGARPYVGATIGELLARMEKPPRPPTGDGPRVPGRIYRAIVRGLASSPQHRWPGMRELLAQLRGGARKVSPWLVAPLVAATLAVGGGVAWKMKDDGGACTRGQEQLVGVWDDGRQQALDAAFTDSKISYARATLERVVPLLSDYAAGWVASYTRSCQAHQEGEISAERLDQRMGCLRARKGELRALVDVLTEGSASAVENASHAAAALVPLERCDDDAATGARAPRDPALEARVLALGLERIKAEYDAGLYDSGLLLSTEAVTDARALADGPALAEALGFHGMLLLQKGQFPEAEAALLEAEVLADSHADDRLRAELLASLVVVIGERQSRPAEGLRVAQQAWGALRRLGGDPAIEAWLLIVEGSVLRVGGDLANARQRLERALELAEREAGEGNKLLALGELGNVAIALKEYPAAGHYLEEALALTRRALGPRHPKLVYFSNNLASLYVLDGRPDAAELMLQEALQIASESLGPEHPTLATVLDSLGLLRLERGDPRSAILQFDRARAILEAGYGTQHGALMPVLLDLLAARIALDAVADANASADQALAIRDANGGESPLDDYLAHLLLKLEPRLPPAESERARRYIELSLRIASALNLVPTRIAGLAALARREHAAGKTTRAREHIAEAAELELAASSELDPADIGRARLALAGALWQLGERERGLALAAAIRLPDVGAAEERAALTAWLTAARAGQDPAP